jgi:hypothetical protein
MFRQQLITKRMFGCWWDMMREWDIVNGLKVSGEVSSALLSEFGSQGGLDFSKFLTHIL